MLDRPRGLAAILAERDRLQNKILALAQGTSVVRRRSPCDHGIELPANGTSTPFLRRNVQDAVVPRSCGGQHEGARGVGLSLLDRDIRTIVLSRIDLIRTKQLVFPELLQPMRQPTRHSGDGKERGEQVHFDAHFVVDDT